MVVIVIPYLLTSNTCFFFLVYDITRNCEVISKIVLANLDRFFREHIACRSLNFLNRISLFDQARNGTNTILICRNDSHLLTCIICCHSKDGTGKRLAIFTFFVNREGIFLTIEFSIEELIQNVCYLILLLDFCSCHCRIVFVGCIDGWDLVQIDIIANSHPLFRS